MDSFCNIFNWVQPCVSDDWTFEQLNLLGAISTYFVFLLPFRKFVDVIRTVLCGETKAEIQACFVVKLGGLYGFLQKKMLKMKVRTHKKREIVNRSMKVHISMTSGCDDELIIQQMRYFLSLSFSWAIKKVEVFNTHLWSDFSTWALFERTKSWSSCKAPCKKIIEQLNNEETWRSAYRLS